MLPEDKIHAQQIIKLLIAFAVTIYFIGGIWYLGVFKQLATVHKWDGFIGAMVYSLSIMVLAYIAHNSQAWNLTLCSISALGIGLLITLTGLGTPYHAFAYKLVLNFGLAAADLFYWYVLWYMGTIYGGRKAYGLG